jgi:hypothetical protein
MHVVPPAIRFGIGANLGDDIVHDPQRRLYSWRIVTVGVRRLVDSGERPESERRAALPNPARQLGTHVPVDVEPAGHVSREMHTGGAQHEPPVAADLVAGAKAAANDLERAQRTRCELEHRRCGAVEIARDREAAVAHVAA